MDDGAPQAAEPAGVQRFRCAVAALGADCDIVTMQERTHTAEEAALAVGCPVGAIVKSLVFLADGDPILVLVSGENRVDVDALGRSLGVTMSKADASLVKQSTGYSIGGVPPFGHQKALRTVVDQDLMELEQLWAAAGAPTSVFCIEPPRLVELSAGTVVKVN